MRYLAIGILVGVCLTPFILSQVAADDTYAHNGRKVPEIAAMRVNPGDIGVDGRLDEPAWNDPGLDFARDFTQEDPDEGQPSAESTLVAVTYDETGVYFAFWCYDSQPDKIANELVRRDRVGESDWIGIRLDPYHDHQTGYSFLLQASGTQRDVRLFDDGNSDDAWNSVWQSGVRMQPWGWSAEVKIPYHCLRFTEKDEHVWGVNFVRNITRLTEQSIWSYVPSSVAGFASKFGHLTGLKGIRPASHMEVLPHIVGSVETEPKSLGNTDGRDYMKNVGADMKYGLTSNLTLDATINPDFGQVELDRPVLNLSAYETWYPEMRPFFMEGAELFSTPYSLFYSRRIGRAPSLRPEYIDPNFLYYEDRPLETTILGAAKITGKLAGKTSIAFLGAVTEEEMATYASRQVTQITADSSVTDTVSTESVVEPRAGYSAFRIKQDIWNNSSIGGMMTLASQDTRHPAVTGAIDWRLNTRNNKWLFRGQSVFSRVDNENIGFATDATIEKASGYHFLGAIGTVIKDENLNINHLGYTLRNNYREGWIWMGWRTTDDWWIFRNTWNNINVSSAWNYAGENITRIFNFNNTMQFINNWYGWAGLTVSTPTYDDMETRGRGPWEYPASWNAWLCFDTDERRPLSLEFDFTYGDSRTNPWWGAEVGVRVKPASNMVFWVHGTFTHDFDQLMWISNRPADTILFAEKDQDIFNLDVSASIVFTPNLSCQLSAQGLLTGLDFYNYRPYIGGGYYGPCVNGYNYDYHYSALNSTFLLRWEYSPGSTLYLVWTRSREEVDPHTNDLDLNRDISRWFSYGSRNIFLVKASYWLNI